MSLLDLARERVQRLFRPVPGAGPRLGVEVELLVRERRTGRPASIRAATLPVLVAAARAQGWQVGTGGAGTPCVLLPHGGQLSFEPGGQLEYSTPPHGAVASVMADVEGVLLPLRARLAEAGLELLAAGLDPVNTLDHAPLQLDAPRYTAMAAYFRHLRGSGERMMRLTASLQVHVDLLDEPLAQWTALNAAAPVLGALFANAPAGPDAPEPAWSGRLALWRHVDASRTGLPWDGAAPVARYLEFALGAPDLLRRSEDGRWRPCVGWLQRGLLDEATFDAHLSTLFPEVRPRDGRLELRTLDAQPLERLPAVLAIVAALAYAPAVREDAIALLGPPAPAQLARAATVGLADVRLARQGLALLERVERAVADGAVPCVSPSLAGAVAAERARATDLVRRALPPKVLP